ncbi:MAG: hypothetical protein SVM79_09115 [Chloroflexota bacterium]|nr:hypothetical protein [Chloroflexota bacterium]
MRTILAVSASVLILTLMLAGCKWFCTPEPLPLTPVFTDSGTVERYVPSEGDRTPERMPFAPEFTDWELHFEGTATSDGSEGFVIDGWVFSVVVNPGDTAEDVGRTMTKLLRANGLQVDSETTTKLRPHPFRPTSEPYFGFMLREVRQQPLGKSGAQGISAGFRGPIHPEDEERRRQFAPPPGHPLPER